MDFFHVFIIFAQDLNALVSKVLTDIRTKMGLMYDNRYTETKLFVKDVHLALGAKAHTALDAGIAGLMDGLSM